MTFAAGAKVESPGWLAVIEQVPSPFSVTVVTETLQTNGVVDAKLTVRPELAVALSGGGVAVRAMLLMGPNVIVWAPSTVKVWTTGVAAACVASPD